MEEKPAGSSGSEDSQENTRKRKAASFNDEMKECSKPKFPHPDTQATHSTQPLNDVNTQIDDDGKPVLATNPLTATNKGQKDPVSLDEVYNELLLKNPDYFKNENVTDEDGVLADTIYIAQLFPNVDFNQIFHMMEAHFDRANRLQLVTHELLGAVKVSKDSSDEGRC